MRIPARAVFAALFVIPLSMVLFAINYLQEYLGLDPCPMCILSRYCFIVIAAISLAAAIHGPKGVGLKVYAGLVALFALAGAGVSIRHSYLQHFPPKVETCGADLDFLLGNMPFSQALPKIFAGTGSCSSVHWKFLGLSIPEWALVWFVVLGAAALWAAFRKPRT
jgi:disulfide bond formation protein DsbB